jgi:hypothetical protein
MQNETAKPRMDSAVMVLKVRSLAIEEIVFMSAPFIGPQAGPTGSMLRTKIFMQDFPGWLIESQRQGVRPLPAGSSRVAATRDQARDVLSTLAMVEAVMAARSEAS